MAGSFVAGGVAQPPAAGEGLKLVGRSLPRGPSGKAARKLGGAGGQDLSFSSGPEAHAVAWYVTLKQMSSL